MCWILYESSVFVQVEKRSDTKCEEFMMVMVVVSVEVTEERKMVIVFT